MLLLMAWNESHGTKMADWRTIWLIYTGHVILTGFTGDYIIMISKWTLTIKWFNVSITGTYALVWDD